jgi:hypothetical protein
VARALIDKVVSHVFIVVDTKPDVQPTIQKLVDETLSIFKNEPQKHVMVLCGDIPDIVAAVQTIDAKNPLFK